MKHLLLTLLVGLLLGGSASAQRFRVGARGGVNFSDYKFEPVTLAGTRFSPGPSALGYEAGIVLRFNITRRLHLQTEIDYSFVNYDIRAAGNGVRTLHIKTERMQIPVQIGLQFGVVRLFGGVQFRVAQSADSSVPRMLKIGFNDGDIALTGGLGLHISHFFLDFRITGFPRSRVRHTFTSQDETARVKVPHDIVYGATLGFFF